MGFQYNSASKPSIDAATVQPYPQFNIGASEYNASPVPNDTYSFDPSGMSAMQNNAGGLVDCSAPSSAQQVNPFEVEEASGPVLAKKANPSEVEAASAPSFAQQANPSEVETAAGQSFAQQVNSSEVETASGPIFAMQANPSELLASSMPLFTVQASRWEMETLPIPGDAHIDSMSTASAGYPVLEGLHSRTELESRASNEVALVSPCSSSVVDASSAPAAMEAEVPAAAPSITLIHPFVASSAPEDHKMLDDLPAAALAEIPGVDGVPSRFDIALASVSQRSSATETSFSQSAAQAGEVASSDAVAGPGELGESDPGAHNDARETAIIGKDDCASAPAAKLPFFSITTKRLRKVAPDSKRAEREQKQSDPDQPCTTTTRKTDEDEERCPAPATETPRENSKPLAVAEVSSARQQQRLFPGAGRVICCSARRKSSSVSPAGPKVADVKSKHARVSLNEILSEEDELIDGKLNGMGSSTRRQVRPALCSLVRQHIKDSRDAGKLDDAFLEELPRALRNEVLRDINMRVIGKAPIFASCNRKYNGIDENDNNKQNHDGSKKSLTDVLKSRNSCSPSRWGATSHLVKQKGNSHLFNASGDQRASAGWNSQASTRSGHDDKGLGNRRQSRLGNCVYISRVGAAIGSELLFGVPQYATFTSVNRTVCLAVFRDDLMTVLNDFAADAKQMRRNFVESIRLEDPERAVELELVLNQWRSSAVTELLYASAQGDVRMAKVRDLLESDDGEAVAATDSDYDGRTALHLASAGGHVNVIKLLVKHDANVNAQDRHGNTPLYDAYTQKKTAAAQLLRTLNGILFYSKTRMANELCGVGRDGDVEAVRCLLELGCDPNALNDDGRTCLHVAAAIGNLTVAGVLIENGASPNARDNAGFTPMFEAANSD
ncbi:MAG: hypothetical protein SGPRY_002928 [Prymnesium sp.]